MAVPILVGWLLGHPEAGMVAATGGFTALYGGGRPYLSRARELALIALGFATATTVGLAVYPLGSVAVTITLALIAMIATWLGNAFQIGPPGPYMFLLATAAASSGLNQAGDPLTAGLLVLAGGGFAWLLSLIGAVATPRGPERTVVLAAGDAVAAHAQALGTDQQSSARHAAARALHRAWTVLVNQQPSRVRSTETLASLRAVNRRLHALFADAVHAGARGDPAPESLLEEVRTLQALARGKGKVPADALPPGMAPGVVPLGHPGPLAALTDALAPGASIRTAVLRVGVAAAVVGVIGTQFHLERSYWAVAAAVLILHQGFDWKRTAVRAVERITGTWIGLLLAAGILLLHPEGVMLALVVLVLQFTIEMLVLRTYSLAVVFITSAALVLASGGHRVPDVGAFVLARGIDTAVGCTVALLVCLTIRPRSAPALPSLMVRLLRRLDTLAPHVATGDVTSERARAVRRDLQHGTFVLDDTYHVAVSASAAQRRLAEHSWPVIAATQQLAYRTLALCWFLEHEAPEQVPARCLELFGTHGEAEFRAALAVLTEAIIEGRSPAPLGPLPPVLERELANLHDCLTPADG